MRINRRVALGVLAAAAALSYCPAAIAQSASLRIGIIGTGNVGGALARHWAAAGHELVISSRNPEELRPLAASLGSRVRAATPREAAAYGDVVVVAVPYGATPQIGRDYAAELAGKVVIDTGNPFASRDGEMAEDAIARGTGVASAEHLPGTRLVRAFNAIAAGRLASESGRAERIAVPIAGDDAEALRVAERLVRDAGFEPVVVGGLPRAKEFDMGGPLQRDDLTAEEFRDLMGSLTRCWGWLAALATDACRWFF